MTLTIDKTPIDFTLENEKSLKEVVENINSWLSKSQLIIEKIFINNSDYSLKDFDQKLEDVNQIDIETLSFRDLNIHNISWIIYFFERLTSAISDWDEALLKQVKNEIPFVLEHLPTLLSSDNFTKEEIYSKQIEVVLTKYNFFQCKETDIDKPAVESSFSNIILLLNERLNEFSQPKDELKASVSILNSLREDIESVSMFLQSGQEQQAAAVMGKFTNIFQKIIRIMNFNINNSEVIGTINVVDFTSELNDILNELLQGYESQDIVLIGDILEYELSPRVEELNEILG